MSYEVHHGDCLEVMKSLPDNSVDAVVTDPPYGLSFMGKRWDYDVPSVEIWQEVLRVLKPGGHLLSFGGTRTYHRMVVNIEDAGFEIRDQIQWIYGSGFPKSLDVSKAMDKQAGAEREVTGQDPIRVGRLVNQMNGSNPTGTWQAGKRCVDITTPATESAKQWEGWGTALKPANEPICLARKPLIGTVAENVKTHGTGAMNIDGCRVGSGEKVGASGRWGFKAEKGWNENNVPSTTQATFEHTRGRFPANVIHDGSDEVVGLFPQSKSTGGTASLGAFRNGDVYGKGRDERELRDPGFGDSGSAARFFYCAKASKADRNAGLEGFEIKRPDVRTDTGMGTFTEKGVQPQRNCHPTVKPTELMRYLCRLITPPNGTVLDPFAGSGSTGKAATLEGFSFIGIEREEEYAEIARARIAHVSGGLFV